MDWGIPTWRPPAASWVQVLYELCKRTFPAPSTVAMSSSLSSSPPPDHAICAISSLMDTIIPVDVGLRDDNLEDGRGFGFFESNFLKNSARAARMGATLPQNEDFGSGIACTVLFRFLPSQIGSSL